MPAYIDYDARRAASDCIDRCTAKLPRTAAAYPHDVVIIVHTDYPTPHTHTDSISFHADDATVSREYAKQLRRAYKRTDIRVRRAVVQAGEYFSR